MSSHDATPQDAPDPPAGGTAYVLALGFAVVFLSIVLGQFLTFWTQNAEDVSSDKATGSAELRLLQSTQRAQLQGKAKGQVSIQRAMQLVIERKG